METRHLFNMLAIVGGGAFAGVMLNIGLTLGSYWKSLPPEDFLNWFGTHSHLIGRTIPFVAGPAVIGILGSLWLGRDAGSRLLWGISLVAIMLLFAITAIYHLPTNAAFVARSIPIGDVPATLDLWLQLHWARVALGFVATVAGTVAITRQAGLLNA